MPSSALDHITVAVHSLEAGVALLNERLGVSMAVGGKHPRMGTQNALLRLGERQFLEVIAIDPTAAPPAGRRWFRLDELSATQPMCLAWVARTDDLQASLSAASEPMGSPEPLSRGALRWQMALTQDGRMPLDDAGPMLIQWDTPEHPAQMLADQGCSLASLTLLHPQPARVERLLSSIGFAGAVTLASAPQARLRVQLRGPLGVTEIAFSPLAG